MLKKNVQYTFIINTRIHDIEDIKIVFIFNLEIRLLTVRLQIIRGKEKYRFHKIDIEYQFMVPTSNIIDIIMQLKW